MQVNVEKLGPCQAKIRFTVPSDEFHGAVRRALSNAGRNAKMKGFRPGHVPTQVIERQFGAQIRNEAVEHFARQAYEQAVKENELKVVGLKRIDLEKIQVLEGADFSHDFDVSLRPEIELGTYKGIAVESELEPVMDQEVEGSLATLKVQQARPEPAGDAGLPEDGMAVVKVEWLAGDEILLARDGLRLSPDTPTPGADPEAFKTALVGVKDGETREVAMTVPEDFDRAELRGKPGLCRMTIAQAFRMVPPSDADIRKMFAVEDEAALRKVVRAKIEEAKLERENQRIESAILDKLLADHTIELPEMMVDEQTNARVAELARQLEQQGTPKDRVEEQAQSQSSSAREASIKGMRALFLVQTIAEKENLLVSREDMQKEVQAIAERNRATVEEVNEYYKKNNLYDQMAIEILERKVRTFLRENAHVTAPR